MKRSTRMEKLADINLGYENMAVAALATARANYQKQEDQLNQLKIYREDYRNQLSSRMKSTTSAGEIRDFQYFFASLDDAIAQQTLEVQKASEQLEVVEKNWLTQRREVQKFSRAADNLRRQESADLERKAQLESDELCSSNLMFRNRNSTVM